MRQKLCLKAQSPLSCSTKLKNHIISIWKLDVINAVQGSKISQEIFQADLARKQFCNYQRNRIYNFNRNCTLLQNAKWSWPRD